MLNLTMQKPTRLIKIIVFGATGRTGKLVCKRILNSGVIVTGFGRSAKKDSTYFIDPALIKNYAHYL